MIQSCRRAFLCFAVYFNCMAVPLVAAPAPGGGGTTVTVDGSTVTITVHIDLCCVQDASEHDIQTPLVMAEVKAAQDVWNQALAELPAKGCYSIKVVFDARLLNKGDPWDPGYHHIDIHFTEEGVPGSYWPKTIPQNADSDYEYMHSLNGDFYEPNMSVGTWAHEIGHLMGLGDDYYGKPDYQSVGVQQDVPDTDPSERWAMVHKAGDCLPGRDPTLMCNSKTGIIDQDLADRLADILNSDGLLPQCWIGTFKGHSEGNVYNDTMVVALRFAVGGNGSVIKGKGLATMTHAPQRLGYCTHTRRVSPDQFDVNIGGRLEREPDALFKLELSTEQRATYQFTTSACEKGQRNITGPPVSGQPPFPASLKDFYHPEVPAKDGASSTWNGTNGTSGISNTSSIEIHEVRQTPIKQVQPDGRRQ